MAKVKNNLHLISDPKIDANGNLIRIVDGKEIVQIPETNPQVIKQNELINLWRMRKK